MKNLYSWYAWSITTKIMVSFLALCVLAMAAIGYITIRSINTLGDYALETSAALGESAIRDSTQALNQLGEETINQTAENVARQIELYLGHRPPMTLEEMRSDPQLREIAVRPVGTTGYTTLIDPSRAVIIIHKYPEQEKDISSLKETLPAFWNVLASSAGGKASAGYYDWLEVDGSISEKYASIVPIETGDGQTLTLWATTYIDEFSHPAAVTESQIDASIAESAGYISSHVTTVQSTFFIIISVLVVFVIIMALFLSRVITRPILALKQGAEAIGRGELDQTLRVRNKDELGELAGSFNSMSRALKTSVEKLRETADENIAKERQIQDNLRLYTQKISAAQEAERRRIARDLHDETAQSLIVVSRQLEDLNSGNSSLSIGDIRAEVRRILKEVRLFSQRLRPSLLDDLGLVPALKWLASDLTQSTSIKVNVRVDGEAPSLPQESELMLFRIAQEALNNVRKHSGATEVGVVLNFSAGSLELTVKDNGAGFTIPAATADLTRESKLGLAGIEERVQLLNGKLDIESQPGKGTNITMRIPV